MDGPIQGNAAVGHATIPEVLLSIEARAFWERVYIANLHGNFTESEHEADHALRAWRTRFERKAGE